MSDYDTVLADARRLPLVDRVQLIEALWDTLPADCLPPLTDEWIAEIQRRSAEYDSGLVQTVPWEQIRADALNRAGLTVPDDTDATR
ncbi:MAG TPA: addiction module protein [Thermoguttaceae bacterium]|nr:addiction module protein [Thermoguttaceae bacterium]